MKNPKILYIRVSENCNSNCFMCHYAGKKDSYNITIDEYEKVLEYAIKSKIKMIRFTGGEPLIHPDIIEFLKRARDLQLDTSIITNGFLLKIKYQDLLLVWMDHVQKFMMNFEILKVVLIILCLV